MHKGTPWKMNLRVHYIFNLMEHLRFCFREHLKFYKNVKKERYHWSCSWWHTCKYVQKATITFGSRQNSANILKFQLLLIMFNLSKMQTVSRRSGDELKLQYSISNVSRAGYGTVTTTFREIEWDFWKSRVHLPIRFRIIMTALKELRYYSY